MGGELNMQTETVTIDVAALCPNGCRAAMRYDPAEGEKWSCYACGHAFGTMAEIVERARAKR